jgi:hypothetical protein
VLNCDALGQPRHLTSILFFQNNLKLLSAKCTAQKPNAQACVAGGVAAVMRLALFSITQAIIKVRRIP